jgi:glycosyltransferase involved in cell wall biosynthesis
VLFTGRFPGEDLTALYNAAELFVLPSKYEGFGIPLIEAFSCGIPVVSSNASCLPEIGGDAAVYFDPDDIESLRDTMTRILSDKHLQTSMIEKGLSRATAFTWQRTAEQTLETYDRAISTTNVRGA